MFFGGFQSRGTLFGGPYYSRALTLTLAITESITSFLNSFSLYSAWANTLVTLLVNLH
jgi:hypothetical protein